jgi:signal transduction histidine kinase
MTVPRPFRLTLPDTLFARIALVLVVNLLLVWAVAALLVEVDNRIGSSATPYMVGRIVASVRMIDATPPEQRADLEGMVDTPGFEVSIMPPEDASRLQADADLDRDLVQSIDAGLRAHPPKGVRPPAVWAFLEPGVAPNQKLSSRTIRIAVGLSDGRLAAFRIRLTNRSLRQLPAIALAVSVCVIVSLTSLLFARSFSRQLAGFASAADLVGRSALSPPLPLSGPSELRVAARAFNVMQDRLRRFVRDRTQMLAAISHDLRTPLTRLRLRAEFIEDDEQRQKVLNDIAEMDGMIRETLAFARDDVARERRGKARLDELIDDLCRSMADGGADVSFASSDPVTIELSPIALRRALANLIDNAIKYGKRARVALNEAAGNAIVTIDDDGSGIPESEMERVFQPFQRIDTSRNRDTGGVGLGLSVARTIIRGHGGDITIVNREEGGLRVTATLPA